MIKIKPLFFSSLILFSSMQLHAADPLGLATEVPGQIKVNNRILAKVNGKAISLFDVMKKMDMLFYREFPQYTSSTQARYQFYKMNWKHVLEELVSKELVLADAEENKLPVSNGDVRQEMESLFGPNIISNLDKIGMGYEEASKIVLGDITIRRMIYTRVNAKAIKKVTPLTIRATYDEYLKNPENIKPDLWKYQVISIRNDGAEKAANLAYNLMEEGTSIEALSEKIKEKEEFKDTSINVSEEFNLAEKDISEIYKTVLLKMEPGTTSKPILQKSRAAKSGSIYRIFVLKDLTKGGALAFNQMELTLKEKLTEKEVSKETDAYLAKLKAHYHVEEDYITKKELTTYEPFSLVR